MENSEFPQPRHHRRAEPRGENDQRSWAGDSGLSEPARHGAEDNRGGAGEAVQRFAADYGWWRVVAIPVLAIITVWVLIDIFTGPSEEAGSPRAQEQDSATAGHDATAVGPDPADAGDVQGAIDQLPPGGEFTRAGEKTYREVGTPGLDVGEGEVRTVRYSVEIENGIDTSSYGGDAAFASMVDATLSDPRGWTNDPAFKFVHVGADEDPDTRFQLTSLETTAELCGAQMGMETSCHTTITGDSTVVVNESRWVRGSRAFEGDVGNYRQYLINHEFGHAIGYAEHQACGGEGKLAPVMMQQTISLNNKALHAEAPDEVYPDEDVTCEPNPWPYPVPGVEDLHDPGHGEGRHD